VHHYLSKNNTRDLLPETGWVAEIPTALSAQLGNIMPTKPQPGKQGHISDKFKNST